MRRRSFLQTVGAAALGAPLFGDLGDAAAGDDAALPDPVETLLPEYRHATQLYAVDGDRDGPTAFVVGGIHGDEPCGSRAATAVATWDFDRGTVFVLPRANEVALRRGTRHGTGGDLNRQFPPGETPTTRLARAMWDAVERRDPDVVVDLHSSKGIYGVHPDFVGQAVYPTDVGDAPGNAAAVTTAMNETTVPWYMPFHAYERGNRITGTAPMLVHKVAGDLNRPGYIVETTKYLLDLETRAAWETRLAARLLSRHGIHRRAAGPDAGGGRSTSRIGGESA